MKSIVLAGLLVGCAALSPAQAQVIEYDGYLLDCDTAYTTNQIGWCTRYLLDKATARMDALVMSFDSLITDELQRATFALKEQKDSSYHVYLNAEIERFTVLQREFHASQEAFTSYTAHCREVTGEMMGMGRERTIQENMTAYALVTSRILVLESWMTFF